MSLADAIAQTGGTPSAFKKETPVGTSVQGRVVSADIQQRRNYEDPNILETWPDGNPKQQVRIIVDTGQPDPDAENTTERAIYVKWWGDQKQALLGAVRAANDTDVREGGFFKATFTNERPSDNPRLSPEKLFAYEYQAPTSSAGLNVGGGEQVDTSTGELSSAAPQQPQQQVDPWKGMQPAAQQPNPYQQQGQAPHPYQQQPAQPQPAAQPAAQQQAQQPNAAENAKTMIGMGMDDNAIASATGLDPSVIASIRNLP